MSENKSQVWMNLREFISYLHDNNNKLYCEVLDFVSASVAKEKGLFLDDEEGEWASADDGTKMAVNLTDKDPL